MTSVITRKLPFAILGLVVALLFLSGGLDFLERRLMDWRFWAAPRQPSGDVVLAVVDSRSLESLEVWPWPRSYHATVLENLIDAGARTVAFDIDFSSRSIAEEDRELENALAASGGRVVLPVFHQWEQDVSHGGRLRSTGPLPALAEQATLATINVQPGPDGLTRYYPIKGDLTPANFPSFAVALFEGPQPTRGFFVDFGIAAAAVPRVSFIDVLTGQFDPAIVRDRVVIVGATAIELGDHLAVPRYTALPGCVVQALAYESLAQGRQLQRIPWAATIAIVFLLALSIGPGIDSSSWRWGLVVTLCMSAALFATSLIVHKYGSLMLDVSPWVLTLLGLYGFVLVRRIDQQVLGLRLQRKRILTTESLMQHVVENSFDAIITFKSDGMLQTLNPSARQMFGCTPEEAVGRNIWELVSIRSSGLEGSPPQPTETQTPFEALGRRLDGTTLTVELVLTAIDAGGEKRQVAFLRDITERKAQQALLEYQATHDALTDLPNRYMLQERFQEALRDAQDEDQPVAFLLLDLDRFKEINDTLGHPTGDVLLQKIAKRLRAPLRPTDTIARLGGDEFAVLLPDTQLEGATAVARRLHQALDEPFQIKGLALQVDAAIGLVQCPEHGTNADELIQKADVAMYVAKRRKVDLVVYESEHDFANLRQLRLTGDLRRAIREDGLSLHYQPKIDAETGKTIGTEALLRWEHHDLGRVGPDEFIGLAEHSGLIRPLTRWVLGSAMRQCAEWLRAGHRIGVSVNISARNLLDDQVQRALEEELEATKVPPELLTLEITESAIMEDPKRAFEHVTELRALGVNISIDDFGTGYSSLDYLRKLPARELKIDRSFVMDMDNSQDDATIVRSIVDLAHNLGLRVVAEGVETSSIWEALKQLGCDEGQGYLFKAPVPPAELLEWVLAEESKVDSSDVIEGVRA